MSISLKSIVENAVKPPRIAIHGLEGIGKSTFAAGAESPIFILPGTEDGLGDIKVKHFPICKTFDEVLECLAVLGEEEHDYKTVVIDTLDALEPLVWAETCKRHGVSSIEEVLKGWGKGYSEALTEWRQLLACFTALRDERGMTVILVAHSAPKPVRDPEHPEYDTNALKLQKLAGQLITEYCDIVGYASLKIGTKMEGKDDDRRVRPVATNVRILRLAVNPAFSAKCRYTGMPDQLPLSWEEFAKHLPKQPVRRVRKPRQSAAKPAGSSEGEEQKSGEDSSKTSGESGEGQ